MNKNFLFSVLLCLGVLAVLIYSATTSTASSVVTIDELLSNDVHENKAVQLGARVSPNSKIEIEKKPRKKVSFSVVAPGGKDSGSEQAGDLNGNVSSNVSKGAELKVSYLGAMPDTLRPGRDLILQGRFDGEVFMATQLVTQCPSKYEPPVPGAGSSLEK